MIISNKILKIAVIPFTILSLIFTVIWLFTIKSTEKEALNIEVGNVNKKIDTAKSQYINEENMSIKQLFNKIDAIDLSTYKKQFDRAGSEYTSQLLSIFNNGGEGGRGEGESLSNLSHETRIKIAQMLWQFQIIDHTTTCKSCNRVDKLFQVFVPTVGCSTLFRIGENSDGGKYVCNIHHINPNDCRVYSFGTASTVGFDLHITKLLGCYVDAFDPTVDKSKILRKLIDKKVTFHELGLGPLKNNKEKTLKGKPIKTLDDITRELGHHKVDILKVDIEGSEVPAFKQIFTTDILSQLKTKLILVEYHGKKKVVNCEERENLYQFIKLFYDHGFLMYSAESNILWVYGIEYGFIHKDFII